MFFSVILLVSLAFSTFGAFAEKPKVFKVSLSFLHLGIVYAPKNLT
jgi:hypothetical protein